MTSAEELRIWLELYQKRITSQQKVLEKELSKLLGVEIEFKNPPK